MAINFPSAPTEGQFFQGTGNLWYQYLSGVWEPSTGTAQPANLLVNGSMQVSQQNGTTGASTNGYYAADQWVQMNGGVNDYVQAERMDFKSVKGSKYRWRPFFWAAKSSWATNEFLMTPYQVVEQPMTAPLQWGTVDAKPIVVRFWLYAPQGTYGFCVRNAPAQSNRSYVTPMVVSAGQHNTNHERVFVIPGDQSGDWVGGMQFSPVLGCGTTYRTAVLDQWQAGNFLGPSTIKTNFALAELFEFQDIGMYVDPDSWGRAPPFEIQPESTAMLHAMRYWYKLQNVRGMVGSATTLNRAGGQHPVRMRTNATVGIVGAPSLYDVAVNNAMATIGVTYPNPHYPEFSPTSTGMTSTRAGLMLTDAADAYVAVNAR